MRILSASMTDRMSRLLMMSWCTLAAHLRDVPDFYGPRSAESLLSKLRDEQAAGGSLQSLQAIGRAALM